MMFLLYYFTITVLLRTQPMDKTKSPGKGLCKLFLKLTKETMYLLFRSDIEILKDVPQPYPLLSNHTTDFDCAFIAVASQAPVSFVATENILRMELLGHTHR